MNFNRSLSCFLVILFFKHTLSSSQQQGQAHAEQLTCFRTNHVQSNAGDQADTCHCKPGKKGPIGPPGPRGIPGIKGETGNATEALVNRLETRIRQLELLVAALKTQQFPSSCDDVRKFSSQSDVYKIYPYARNPGKGLDVFCDMGLDEKGWMVFQRRVDPTVSFDRNWTDYKNGFGNINGNYWIGLETMHQITKPPLQYEVRIDILSWQNVARYAIYRKFKIGPESSNYILTATNYSGNAGDSFGYQNGSEFKTRDRSSYCASYNAGWWFSKVYCFGANLNGPYLPETKQDWQGIIYNTFRNGYAMKRSQISVRKIGN